MPPNLELEPAFYVLVIAAVLYIAVWAVTPLSRHLAVRKTRKLIDAARINAALPYTTSQEAKRRSECER